MLVHFQTAITCQKRINHSRAGQMVLTNDCERPGLFGDNNRNRERRLHGFLIASVPACCERCEKTTNRAAQTTGWETVSWLAARQSQLSSIIPPVWDVEVKLSATVTKAHRNTARQHQGRRVGAAAARKGPAPLS